MIRLYILSCMIAAIFTLAITKATAQDRNCEDFLTQEFFASASPEVVAICLEQGRTVDEHDRDHGNTPLHLAVAYGSDTAVTRVLLQTGADPNVKNSAKFTPMHMAAMHATEAAKIVTLAVWGAEVDKGTDNDSCRWRDGRLGRCTTTPLHLAARRKEAEDIIAALLASGASLDTFSGKDLKKLHDDENLLEDRYLLPLQLAAKYADIGAVSTLLKAGAAVDAKDKNLKRTALHDVAQRGNEAIPIVKALVQAEASADEQDANKDTPLMMAAAYTSSAEVFKILLDASNQPCAENEHGSTALDMHDRNRALARDDEYWKLHRRCNE